MNNGKEDQIFKFDVQAYTNAVKKIAEVERRQDRAGS